MCSTDSAIGAQEEDNLRHLVTNLGRDVPRERIVPFLTAKHPIDYCLSYAERAHQSGFPSLVVLGGDKAVGAPRSVEHAWQLRAMLREKDRSLGLGGWANPYADAERQVGYLLASDFHAEFYLTQIVSHHRLAPVRQFIDTARRRCRAPPRSDFETVRRAGGRAGPDGDCPRCPKSDSEPSGGRGGK